MSKKALCIGINDYPGTANDLSGCVNDANDWSIELAKHGFAVTKMLDGQATRAAMTTAIGALISAARAGDTLLITYSGHGTWVPDSSGDEPDGRDEALCPYDIGTAGPLLDDEIRTLFRSIGAGVRILLISDSCHSGSVTRGREDDLDVGGARARFMPLDAWMPKNELPPTGGGDTARGERAAAHRRRSAARRLQGHRILIRHQLPGTAQRRLHLLRPEDPARAQAGQL